MKPHFLPNDLLMFYKYLDNATNYFEFGSGGSTYQSSIRPNIKSIYSVESDPIWFQKVKKEINNSKINFLFCDMETLPNTWGNPGENSSFESWKNYSDKIIARKNIDFLLIDGRFRVACCLKSFSSLDENSYICFDDFLNRSNYHVVLDYFKIVDQTVDKCMVILQKKNVENPHIDKIYLLNERLYSTDELDGIISDKITQVFG